MVDDEAATLQSGENELAVGSGELSADVLLEHVRTQTYPGGMVQSSYRVRRNA